MLDQEYIDYLWNNYQAKISLDESFLRKITIILADNSIITIGYSAEKIRDIQKQTGIKFDTKIIFNIIENKILSNKIYMRSLKINKILTRC